jgi:NAD(P)-dependent dehydrogenase (short-subunit alcohol dehydrogenase family)
VRAEEDPPVANKSNTLIGAEAMPQHQLSDLRILVIGASSGIGLEVATSMVSHGARIVAAARRLDRVTTISGATPLSCDVRDPASCESAVIGAAESLGGLDALVFSAGASRITPLWRSGLDEWQAIFETNVFGAAQLAKAALPFLRDPTSQGRALFLTSDAADLALPGLVAYSASKAALSRFCQGFAVEYPELKVSEVVVGPTAGTEMADGFDPVDFQEWATRWFEEGFVRHGLQNPSDVAAVVLETLIAESPPLRIMAVGPVEARAGSLSEGQRQAAAVTGK